FTRQPCSLSKTLPCQPNRCMSLALIGVRTVPGATRMVPSQSPSGMSPEGLLVYRSSSSFWDIFKSPGTVSLAVSDMVFLLQRRAERASHLVLQAGQIQYVHGRHASVGQCDGEHRPTSAEG